MFHTILPDVTCRILEIDVLTEVDLYVASDIGRAIGLPVRVRQTPADIGTGTWQQRYGRRGQSFQVSPGMGRYRVVFIKIPLRKKQFGRRADFLPRPSEFIERDRKSVV